MQLRTIAYEDLPTMPDLIEDLTDARNGASDYYEGTTSRNRSLYLLPEQLTPNEANEKARPGETPQQRAARVTDMAASIRANGQKQPVLVVEKDDEGVTSYEYVDGGGRVEAIALLNDHDIEGSEIREVWCVVLPPDTDLFKTAYVCNKDRVNPSVWDMAGIVQETYDRHGWRGKGGQGKVAEYLGIPQSRVSEYQSLRHKATPAIKEMLVAGHVTTLDAALALLAVEPDKRESVATAAKKVAQQEQLREAEQEIQEQEQAQAADEVEAITEDKPATAKRIKKERKHNPNPKVPLFDPIKAAKAREKKELALKGDVRVKKSHVQKAAKELGAGKAGAGKDGKVKTKDELIEFFTGYTDKAMFAPAVVEFASYFTEKWVKGLGTDGFAVKLADRAFGRGEVSKSEKTLAAIKLGQDKAAAAKSPAATHKSGKKPGAAGVKAIAKKVVATAKKAKKSAGKKGGK